MLLAHKLHAPSVRIPTVRLVVQVLAPQCVLPVKMAIFSPQANAPMHVIPAPTVQLAVDQPPHVALAPLAMLSLLPIPVWLAQILDVTLALLLELENAHLAMPVII